MTGKRRTPKMVTTKEENMKYLRKIFTMLREIEVSINAQSHEKYNNTEIRLMNEIVYATGTGERLISTQLASRLGITRSAVSQIVAKMEKDGALRRVPDAVDRKIAYIELTDEIAATYKVIVSEYADFVGKVVAYMGASKMERLFTLADEFSEAVALAAEDCNAKK